MISNAKVRPSLKFESDSGLTGGEGPHSPGNRGPSSSKTTVLGRHDEGSDTRIQSKRLREDRGARGRHHQHGRGSYSVEYTRKGRIFTENKTSENIKNVSDTEVRAEDCRISKLLRRLGREDDPEKFMGLTKQLQEVLLLRDNASYIRHSLDLIVESLLDLLHTAPTVNGRREAARCLGRTGYALGHDFQRYIDWIFSKFLHERNEEVRVLLVKALLDTTVLEAENPILAEFAPVFMAELRMALESADTPELLISAVEVLLAFISLYPDCFNMYFCDTLDILVGWVLSLKDPKSRNFVLQSLYRFQHYWLLNTSFAASLLSQFLEDIESYIADLRAALFSDDVTKESPEENLSLITTLLRMFNTVAPCISPMLAVPGPQVPSLTKLLKLVDAILALAANNLLITTANIGVGILLPQLDDLSEPAMLATLEYINTLMKLIPDLDEKGLLSTLQLISKIVFQVGSSLPENFASSLLGPGAPLADLKTCPHREVTECLIHLYQQFLQLQCSVEEVMCVINSEIEPAIMLLTSKTECSTDELNTAENLMSFHLEAVADAVLSSESAVTLLLKWGPDSTIFMYRSPPLHFALLSLIYAHFNRYRDNLPTEVLLDILRLVTQLLTEPIPLDSLLFLLKWSQELILKLLTFPTLLINSSTTDFYKFISTLVRVGRNKMNFAVVLLVGSCLQLLVGFHNLIEQSNLTTQIVELCCYQANSLEPKVVEQFVSLMLNMPLTQTLSTVSPTEDILFHNRIEKIQGYCSRSSHGFLSSRNFAVFMDYLLNGVLHSNDEWLREIFIENYPLGLQSESAAALTFKQTAHDNRGVLLPWVCWEAAQLCVLNKLRTSLGKAPDTFTSIEAAVKAIARFDSRENDGLETYTRARILLEFMEYLEKAMYNAWEGTALTLPGPPKNVRTFFHANKNTCSSWLTRVRWAMMMTGVRVGQAAATVRHGHALLADLLSNNCAQTPEFDAAVLYTAWALLNLRDSEAITGLYLWIRQEADRKISWLLPMAQHAASRYELAAEGYKTIFSNGYTSPGPAPDGSPAKTVKVPADSATQRFLYDCLLDCYRRLDDYSSFLLWLENKDAIINHETKNGTSTDKFLYLSRDPQDVVFTKCVQDILINRCAEYRWKCRTDEIIDEPEDGQSIKALDQSILDARISLPAKTDFDERCKQCLLQLSDWSQISLEKRYDQLSTDNVIETIRQSLIKDALFVHMGQTLESKSFVLHMSESKIEIDLHVKQLMDQLGIRYNFEMSNILKGVKENYATKKDEALGSVTKSTEAIEWLLRENLRSGRSSNVRDLIVLEAASRDLLNGGLMLRNFDLPYAKQPLPSDSLLHIAFWKRLLGGDDLKLQILRSARKEGNLDLAKRSLRWHFKGTDGANEDLVDICDDLVENLQQTLCKTKAELCLQVAKLLYSTGAAESAIDMGSLIALKLIHPENEDVVRQCGSRMLLTLVKWLQKQPTQTIPPSVSNLIQIKNMTMDDTLSMPCDTINDQKVISENEMAIGRILAMSVAHSKTLGKTWSQYASWCYRWGRKMVDVASHSEVSLSEVDVAKIKEVIPAGTPDLELEGIIRILSHTRAVPDEDHIEAENLSTIENIQAQLLSIPALIGADQETLSTLVNVWRESQMRVSSAFRKAAQAYVQYLRLCADNQCSDSRTLTATLRILRLLVKHAVELQGLLEKELPTTPPQPWQGIIPQLFSRLNHPESYVRRCLSELLCRIAHTSPNLIIFPAVVGSSAGANRIADINKSTSKLLATCLSQNSDDEGNEQEDEAEEDEDETVSSDSQNSVLMNCYLTMVDTLSKQSPDAVGQVQLLVSELRRITLLWDELWLGTLNQHHSEVSRRLSQLEVEVRKVDNNPSLSAEEKPALIAEKHRIIMKPVVFILEQLQAITSVTPETPHEIWFQEKLGEAINAALDKLRNPTDPRNPTDSWHSFRTIHSKLQKRAQKRACAVIKLENISPVLHALQGTAIPMPGVSSPSLVTISSISNNVLVLPTKTKPKKLVFTSNNGTTHTYLFKGLEDLHLDERIMQLLTIANTMLASRGSSDYRARHYSVTPLGPRSGLISWVDRVIPLFTLYKKWQQRDSANRQSSTAHSGNVAMRPSELFYNKLTPLLKEAGVPVERRKEWPPLLLKQVLQELMKETPRDLLAKELWCNSVHVDEWWITTKRYCRSVAVMSVIGYIIGLGDRHLDNVLIDLHTGEMVHIDYNVCFEKGKTLRVPEKVPFRMTQNIKTALGVTGVEGQFQLSCEHVLKVLKQGRETLLPLLEAFVYDPLIDWTPGSETGYTGAVYGGGEAVKETRQSRKALEREVTRAMFIVRIAEMQAEWLDNRDKVLQVLPQVGKELEKYLAVLREGQTMEESLADAHQQMFLVKEAEAMGHKHPLFNLPTRCSLILKARSAHAALSQTLREKRDEYDRCITSYQNALKEIRGEGLSHWLEMVSSPQQPDSFQMFDLVKQFLQTAGQSGMVTQCDETETEVGQLDGKQRQLIRSCVDLLGEYGALIALYPNCLDDHRTWKLRNWADRLLINPNATECAEVLAEFHTSFGEGRSNNALLGKQAIAYASALQNAVNEAQNKLKRSLDRLKSDGPPSAVEAGRSFNETRQRLIEFTQSDRKAAHAVELILISGLCNLNQRFLKMEAAAKSAEESLEGMRLKEGQSWLEEMYLVSGLITEMAALLPSLSNNMNNESSAQIALLALNKAHSIYRDLLELHTNFHSIILPEALKCTQTEHPDMMNMLADLAVTISAAGTSLDDLQKQLKLHLRALIMDMKSAHGDVQARVARLRSGLEALLQRPCQDAGRSPGQMLLMGFHGLFEKLQVEGRQMMTMLTQIPIPPAWRKIDQLRDASNLTALALDARTRSTTDDVFIVRRVQTMQELFALCDGAGAAFRGTGPPVVYDDDRLNRPIRRFAAEFVSRIMLGAASQTLAAALCSFLHQFGVNLAGEIEKRDVGSDGRVPLEDLCRRALDMSLQKGATSNHLVTQAATLSTALQARYRHQERGKLLTENVEAKERALTRLQALLTSHSWYHEDVLQEALNSTSSAIHNRSSFMTKLRKASSSLLGLQSRLTEARDGQRALVASVEQRLKWAAGANPALVDVLAAFASGVASLDRRLDADSALAVRVGNVCSAVIRYEALRTRTTEALAHDETMRKIIEDYLETASLLAGCSEHVSPAEESLLQLMTPESCNDPKHLQKLELKISENIEKLKTGRAALEKKLAAIQVDCETEVEKLKALLTNHHALMTEVRHLLKTMAKFEEWGGAAVADYLEAYREFSENIGSVVSLLSSNNTQLTTATVESALLTIEALPDKITMIYDDLVNFADKGRADSKRRPPLLRQESVCGSPQHLGERTSGLRVGKGIQERNAYAMGVWRRIQMKLEGRDPDPGRRSTPHEQIEYIIREATSLDNLALLYEGWTPWV